MKRKPSQEMMFNETNSKETIKRLKSPSNKRLPSKKQSELNSIILHKPKPFRNKEEFKVDSNNTTATTKAKPAKNKKIKMKQNSELGQREILDIINLFATKIQRQWRAYILRKRLHHFVRDSRSTHLKQQSNDKPSQLSFDQAKIKRLARFIEQDSSEDSPYDKEKYTVQSSKPYKFDQNQKNSKNTYKQLNKPSLASHSSKSSNITPRNRLQQFHPTTKTPHQSSELKVQELSKSLEKSYRSNQLQQFPKSKQERRASFNIFQAKKISQNRRHSTGDLQPPIREINKKSLQIGKAFDLIIQQPNQMKNSRDQSLNSPHSSRKGQKIQTQAAIAFSKVAKLEQLKVKFKKQLQMSKFKQLLSAQNRYKKNEVTYRSYLQLVSHIKQEHSSKIKQIIVKEGELKVAWKELLALYHCSPQDTRFLEDENHMSTSNMDVSISFERWDFNSSAKKSIQAFDLPETNGSKVLSIESVLRQLDEEDDVEGKGTQQKKFKRNKSVQVIQAIAQQSKQISEKDAGSYEELSVGKNDDDLVNPPNQVNKQTIQYHNFTPLKILQQKNIFSQNKINQKQQQKQISLVCEQNQIQDRKYEHAIENITPLINKVDQYTPSQSLLISPGSPNPLFSEDCISKQPQLTIIKEIQSPTAVIGIDLNDPLVLKFRQLAIERIVMTNIKIINSIKFVCVRAGQELKRKRTAKAKPIPIDSDINGVNTWLLQVSHFILDNYQKVIRQNIVDVKQPPGLDMLAMARKGLDLLPLYQTIPQYIFKDFEFYFIKTQARNSNIPADNYDRYSTLTYTFHRSLVDSLNLALMDELSTGRDWIYTPWQNSRKFKSKRICPEQAKVCLERAINVVSNWGEYGLGRMNFQAEVSEVEHRLYEQQKISLVCRQQVLEMNLNHPFSLGFAMLQLGELVVQQEIRLAAAEISSLNF